MIQNLVDALKNRGITHKEIATKFSTTQQNISRILKGNDMKVSFYVKVCESFDISFAELHRTSIIINDSLSEEDNLFNKYDAVREINEKLNFEVEKYKNQIDKIQTLEKLVKTQELAIELLQKK